MRRWKFPPFFFLKVCSPGSCLREGGAEGKGRPGREERPIRGEIEGAKLISISGGGAADGRDDFGKHVQFPSSLRAQAQRAPG